MKELKEIEDLIKKTFNEEVKCFRYIKGTATIFYVGERKDFTGKLLNWLGDKVESIDYDSEENDTFIYLK